MIQVRRIKPEDIQGVLDLFVECGCPTEGVLKNIGSFLICESGGILCGCGCSVLSYGKCYVNWILVKESYRRDHIGSSIMKSLLNIAELSGAKDAYAPGPSVDFLKSLSFEAIKDESTRQKVDEEFRSLYGSNYDNNLYHVSLIDYFKPCCGHKII